MDWDLVIIMPSVIVMLLILGVSANGIVSKILEHKPEPFRKKILVRQRPIRIISRNR